MDRKSILALVLALSFVIDRISTAVLLLINWTGLLARWMPDPQLAADNAQRVRAENRQRLAYALVMGLLALSLVIGYDDLRVLQQITRDKLTIGALFDFVATLLLLMGGSDLIGRVLNLAGAGNIGVGTPPSTSQPIEVRGRLVLEEDAQKQAKPERLSRDTRTL